MTAEPETGEAGAATWPEVAVALALALAAVCAPAGLGAAPRIAVVAVLIGWISARDATRFLIPDAALAALAVVAMAGRVRDPLFAFDPWLGVTLALLEAGLATGSVWLVREVYFRLRGHDGVGFGDVKLAGVGALLCGLSGFALALLGASLLGLGAALLARRLGSSGLSEKLPFGAFLAPLLFAAWIAVS